MRIHPGAFVRKYNIFLSSSDELSAVRQSIDELVNSVINAVLDQNGYDINIYVDMWEHTAAQRAPGSHVNQLFVDRALASNLTLVLLQDRLGDGTAEEFGEVLSADEPRPELAVIWFRPSETAEEAETDRIRATLDGCADSILQIRPPNSELPFSPAAWMHIFRVLLDFLLSILRDDIPRPAMAETRGSPVS
jgi:hypothetical protein